MSNGSVLAQNYDLAESIDPRVIPISSPKGTIYRYVPQTGPVEILVKQDEGISTNYVVLSSGGGSGANTSLSNLVGPTSVPVSIIPSSDQVISLGAVGKNFQDAYINILRDFAGQVSIQPNYRILVGPNNHQPVFQWKDKNITFQYDNINGVKDIVFETVNAPSKFYTLRVPFDSSNLFQFPATIGLSGQVLSTDGTGVTSWVTVSGGGANTSLSNLVSPLLNVSINPAFPANFPISSSGQSLGSPSRKFLEVVSTVGSFDYLYDGVGFAGSMRVNLITRNLIDLQQFPSIDWGGITSAINIKQTGDPLPRELRFHDGGLLSFNGIPTFYVGLKAQRFLGVNTTYVLPPDGSSGQVLRTDGAGNLSWVTVSGGGSPVYINAKYNLSGGQSLAPTTSAQIINFNTSEYDTNNLVTTGASWNFKASTLASLGKYLVTVTTQYAQTTFTAATGEFLTVYKNNSFLEIINQYYSLVTGIDAPVLNGSFVVNLNTLNDFFDIRIDNNELSGLSLNASAGRNTISIQKIG